VEPALGSSLAATQGRTAPSDSSTRSNDGFVSVGSARSSSSNNQTSSLPSSRQTTSESAGQLPTCPSGQSPTSPEAQGQPQLKSPAQLQTSEVANTGGSSPIPQPDTSDPFQQSLDALHADQQDKEQQAAPSCLSEAIAVAKQELSSSTQDSKEQANVAGSQPQDSEPSQAPAQTLFSNSTDGSQYGKHAASSSAAGGATGTEGGSEAVNASPVGSASTDAWEMVQDANNIYNWKAGSLFGRSLGSNVRQGSECSEEGESYSQCKQLHDIKCLMAYSNRRELCCKQIPVVLNVSSCTPSNAAAWPVPTKESFAADKLVGCPSDWTLVQSIASDSRQLHPPVLIVACRSDERSHGSGVANHL